MPTGLSRGPSAVRLDPKIDYSAFSIVVSVHAMLETAISCKACDILMIWKPYERPANADQDGKGRLEYVHVLMIVKDILNCICLQP